MDALDLYLQQARSQGRLESSGRFTLDSQRADELLRKFQRARPEFYLLKLVQAAVAGRADRIRIQLGVEQVEVCMFGADLEFFDTHEILRALTDRDVRRGESALAFLTTGLNAVLATEPIRISWSVWNVWRQERLTLEAGGSTLEPLREPPWSEGAGGYRFQLWRSAAAPPAMGAQPGDLWSRLKRWVGRGLPALERRATLHDALSRRLLACPIEVRLDGRLLNRPETLLPTELLAKGSAEARLTAYLDGHPNGVGLPSSRVNLTMLESDGRRCHPVAGQRDVWRACAVAGPTSDNDTAIACFVHYGVLLSSLPVANFPLAVIASARGLTLDVEDMQVVADEVCQGRLRDIFAAVTGPAESPSALAGLAEGLYPTVDRSFVPEEPPMVAQYDALGRLELLEMGNYALSLNHLHRYDRLDAWARQECSFTSPGRSWPRHARSRDREVWLQWLRGAIQCMAQHGRIPIPAESLRGQYCTEGDGVRAELFADGSLKSLACYRHDRPLGWILELQEGCNAGQVRHARSADVHSFPNEEGGDWISWVQQWIELVYRDVQQPPGT